MRLLLALLVSLPLVAAKAAAVECRIALVLALDVSGSVNETEYRQQLDGLASALGSDEVRSAILTGGGTVNLAAFEWSSQNHQFVVQPWITLDSHARIDAAVSRIQAYKKQRAGLKTALSTALLFAADLLRQQSDCWQRTIDVSGDGKNNIGPSVPQVYRLSAFDRTTVNALVVGDPASVREIAQETGLTKDGLKRYFERNVIRGPGAFAMVANGYEDYARAMRRKLLRELSAPVLGLSVP